ncbi:MAG: dTMP kinase [Polyangiaceae bacterium]|nr:dTMP kinase [Polyangiaceae bacterium]
MPDRRGAFIALEGIDGSGTTTHAHRLVDALRQSGLGVELTCEPSRGPVGLLLRQLLGAVDDEPRAGWSTLALLFAADRAHHVEATILPALGSGCWVVSDRYVLSSLVYQSTDAAGDETALSWIAALNSRVPRPDLTLVLDVSPELAERRRRLRTTVREIFDDGETQQRLARAYAAAEELVPGDRLVHIDAEGAVEEVAERILSAVWDAGLAGSLGWE